MGMIDSYNAKVNAQRGNTARQPEIRSKDGGKETTYGNVTYKIFAKRNDSGSMTIQSAGNARHALGFARLVAKIKSDLALVEKGELKDLLGEAISADSYDLKMASLLLGPGTQLRIGSVSTIGNGDLSITLVKTGKAEMPIAPEGAIAQFELRESLVINWLVANVKLREEAPTQAADTGYSDEL